jgi:hypothetical protein
MDNGVILLFNKAAFKHGYTVEDVMWAINTELYDGEVDPQEEDSEDKQLLIGFSTKALPIEVMYNIIDENTINVFHINELKPKYMHLIAEEGK